MWLGPCGAGGVGGSQGKGIICLINLAVQKLWRNNASIESVWISNFKKWTTFPSLSLMIYSISSVILGHWILIKERSICSAPVTWKVPCLVLEMQVLDLNWSDSTFPELIVFWEKRIRSDCELHPFWALVGQESKLRAWLVFLCALTLPCMSNPAGDLIVESWTWCRSESAVVVWLPLIQILFAFFLGEESDSTANCSWRILSSLYFWCQLSLCWSLTSVVPSLKRWQYGLCTELRSSRLICFLTRHWY